MPNHHILYSYRRCPYAMRARMALRYANVEVEIREISLRDKPSAMLQASPKGTVPVLVLQNGMVLEESLHIMRWALQQQDSADWQRLKQPALQQLIDGLIVENDGAFKRALDRYKYPDRFPEQSQAEYRAQGEVFLQLLEDRLNAETFLLGDRLSLADVAIFPFIRQFAAVDAAWFELSPYPKLRAWLATLVASDLFTSVMEKYPTWTE
ncbi:MAG TPA: glutathione S-transferase [Methylophilaceae bacterium]